MKKGLIISFTLMALFAMTTETYKGFFTPKSDPTELTQQNDTEDKDENKKENSFSKDKYFDNQQISFSIFNNQDNYYIQHTLLLPQPYTSVPELPPELI